MRLRLRTTSNSGFFLTCIEWLQCLPLQYTARSWFESPQLLIQHHHIHHQLVDWESWDQKTDAKAGHIPGAAHLEWTELMDKEHNLRLLPLTVIQTMLTERGLTPDKNIVTHCQSHHRSGLTYLVAKILGYPSIKGYHGSWSEWGNLDHTPFETGNP